MDFPEPGGADDCNRPAGRDVELEIVQHRFHTVVREGDVAALDGRPASLERRLLVAVTNEVARLQHGLDPPPRCDAAGQVP